MSTFQKFKYKRVYVIYYSGFALKNDKHFFEEFMNESEYNIAGFSYGAIKAIEYASTCKERIDKIYLFSPAFFQDKNSGFKKLQLRACTKNAQSYLKTFLTNCFLPYKPLHVETTEPLVENLDELLEYEYSKEMLQNLCDRGIEIEVYVGSEDKIIDALHVKEFFLPYATTYLLQGANHFLIKDSNE